MSYKLLQIKRTPHILVKPKNISSLKKAERDQNMRNIQNKEQNCIMNINKSKK